MKKIFFLSLAILCVSCASLPSHEKMKSETQNFQLPEKSDPKKALIYVVRPSFAGFAIRFNVFVDKKYESSEMGYNKGGQYIYFFVEPGNHTIYSKAENWAEQEISAKSGDVLFIKQNPQLGFIMARNSLNIIDETEGKFYIKESGLGTIIKSEISQK